MTSPQDKRSSNDSIKQSGKQENIQFHQGGVKSFLKKIGEKISRFIYIDMEENQEKESIIQIDLTKISKGEQLALTGNKMQAHEYESPGIYDNLKDIYESHNIQANINQDKKSSECRRLSIDSSKTYGTKTIKKKVNPILKISAFITNCKFNEKRAMHQPTPVARSAFKVVDETYKGISFDKKSIINYNDFIQKEYPQIIRPVPMKRPADDSEERKYINKKRQRESSKMEAISEKRRIISNDWNKNSEDGMSRLRSVYQDDASMKSYHTLISQKNKMDVTSQNEKQQAKSAAKIPQSKTLQEIRREIEEKKKDNQKQFDELSKKGSLSIKTATIDRGKNDYDDRKRVLEEYYKNKGKHMKDTDEYTSTKPRAEHNWKEENLSFTKAANISILPIEKINLPKRKQISLVNQESFVIEQEKPPIHEPKKAEISVSYFTENKNIISNNEEKKQESISNNFTTKHDIFSNEKNALTDKKDKHVAINEEITRNDIVEKDPLPAFQDNEKKLFSSLATIQAPSEENTKNDKPLFSSGGLILNKIENKNQKLLKEVPLAEESEKNNNHGVYLVQEAAKNEKVINESSTLFENKIKENLFGNLSVPQTKENSLNEKKTESNTLNTLRKTELAVPRIESTGTNIKQTPPGSEIEPFKSLSAGPAQEKNEAPKNDATTSVRFTAQGINTTQPPIVVPSSLNFGYKQVSEKTNTENIPIRNDTVSTPVISPQIVESSLPQKESNSNLCNANNPFLSAPKNVTTPMLFTSPSKTADSKDAETHTPAFMANHSINSSNRVKSVAGTETVGNIINPFVPKKQQKSPLQNDEMSICTPVTSPKISMKTDEAMPKDNPQALFSSGVLGNSVQFSGTPGPQLNLGGVGTNAFSKEIQSTMMPNQKPTVGGLFSQLGGNPPTVGALFSIGESNPPTVGSLFSQGGSNTSAAGSLFSNPTIGPTTGGFSIPNTGNVLKLSGSSQPTSGFSMGQLGTKGNLFNQGGSNQTTPGNAFGGTGKDLKFSIGKKISKG